ncbi:glycine zipper 2TM domain-containing protein [Kangiella taiwanensis]|uniref:Glycine zipper 2TM domain-containing protein n=1 Tax=Kangiella taiwanensis TaxID=1079179 RepID=A0ABP8I8H4_9GAMM|nr:glycine zipper 2TM domain-containing protein [Kangiella taiwanensis]
MKLKNPLIITSLALSALILPSIAQADHRYDRHAHYSHGQDSRYFIKAKVVDVTPVYDRGYRYDEPVRTCYSERTRYDASDRRRKALVGGVVGGLIGYKIGDKQRHKNAGAVAGALIGATIAKNSGRERTHCSTHYESRYERGGIVGYDVTYKYRGRHYTTFSDYRPGRWIEVKRPNKYHH